MKTPLVLVLVAGIAQLSTAADLRGDANAGRNKVAMCSGCHGIPGYKASFPEVYSVPKIGGQPEPYLIAALNAYRKGERRHPTMTGVAKGLTDQDIADVAAYYARQK